MTERDLAGRTFVVTGANTGIGRATVEALAARGGRVILAARSEPAARAAIDSIRTGEPGADLDFVALDLADLASVRACAAELAGRSEPLHVLINNAGVGGQHGQTHDGFEIHFGVNHLGHFLLTRLLLDKLAASAPARVVTVASKAHYRASGIDYDRIRGDTRTLTGFDEYSTSKLANVLFSAELSRRAPAGVTTYSLHPGVIASDIWRRIPQPLRWLITRRMVSPAEGARTSLFCATAPEAATETGQYYDDCQRRWPSRTAQRDELAAELWERSEALVA